MSVEENRELMQTLDDAWKSQDWDTFCQRHTVDTTVYAHPAIPIGSAFTAATVFTVAGLLVVLLALRAAPSRRP